MIRKATFGDLATIRPLVRAASEELSARFGAFDCTDVIVAGVANAIVAGDAVYVAMEDSQVVGWVAWSFVPSARFAVGLGTYVMPEWRRRGISKRLRDAAEEHCRRQGALVVSGVVAKGNVAALQSCLAEGFAVVGVAVEKELQP